MNKLQDYGKKKLAGKKNRQLVTTHESLGYFAKSFGLEIVGSIQERPTSRRTSGPLRNSWIYARRTMWSRHCHRTAISLGPAEAVQRELARQGHKVALVEIDPLETASSNQLNAELHQTRMKQNIDNLAKALP